MLEIAPGMADEAYPSGVAMRFLDLIEPAELESCAPKGLLAGQSAAQV